MPSDYGEGRAVRIPATMSAYPPPKLSEPLPCPRCHSTNTKFCYYNNYNLSQPRHFCKSCRRYWTHGGTLRNIPVGGGTRRNASSSAVAKRARSSSSTQTVTREPEPVPLPNPVSAGLESVHVHTGPDEPDTNGTSFASMLTGQSDGDGAFLALGGSGLGFGFEYGYGFDEMGLEFVGSYYGGRSETALNANGPESDTWHHGSGAQEDGLVWPGSGIPTTSKNMN